MESYLLAIVTKITSRVWKRPVSETNLVTLDEKVVKAILDVLTEDGVKHGLKGFEFVRIFVTLNELFSVENGCLTRQ